MKEKKLVPKRRFREFGGRWNPKRIEDFLEVKSGRDYKHLQKGSIPVYGTGGYMLSVNDQLSKEDGIGIGRKGTIDKPQYLKAPFWTVDTLFYMVPKENIDLYYFYSKSKNIKWKYLDESTGVPSLSKKTIYNISLYMPTYQEQHKIGEFFKVLDERIANQERKIAKVKALKSAYLTEMFPQEGETVPRRRFIGFEGEWKKGKISNVANYRRGSFPQPYGEDKWYDEIYGMPFVQVVDVANNLKLVNNTKQKISKLAQPSSVYVEKGKVLVTLQGSIGRVAITQYSSYVDRTLLIFESYKFKVDTYYFAYIIQLLFDIEKQKAPGGTIKTITKEALSEFIVKIPCYKEQQKIGEFFKNLDDQITTEEKKLEKLKKMKEAYLEEMLV
ncbi:restriction endonuclease subunit S [Alkalicoccobacillus murimartini]|uniref:Type I restriction enzyme S subunit n=1 Tax=Alkalicoccobacillus murimartini TaxID=171685 RepID=A0ABT9YPY6_9BACI|nr:restriction endonuclease subunit S [Alkalicoccobacillus murimartini]MDQ0209099.1 type I restriction enzyme S subunit [Alkalicoccobacillus murimartini]